MIKRVYFIVNWNLYETKRHFTKKLTESLEKLGIETGVFDIQLSPLEAMDAIAIQQFQPDFICTFNAQNAVGDGKFFYDYIKIPCLSILLDPPMYSLPLLRSPYTILSCVDRFDCDFLLSNNFDRVFFLPHAVDNIKASVKQNRPYDVVFLGSCNDYESLREEWQQQYSPAVCKILDDAVDQVLSDRYIPLAQALLNACAASPAGRDNLDFGKLFYYLDFYTRGVDRVNLIRSIKNARVHIFGEMMQFVSAYKHGWAHYLGGQANVTLHQSVDCLQAFEIMKQSKICLNSMPFFKNGTHERIFNSLACGALALTSDSLYIQEAFKVGEELIVYQPSRWEEANAQIDYFLSHDKERESIVERGQAKVLKEHTWDRRAEQLVAGISPILERLKQK